MYSSYMVVFSFPLLAYFLVASLIPLAFTYIGAQEEEEASERDEESMKLLPALCVNLLVLCFPLVIRGRGYELLDGSYLNIEAATSASDSLLLVNLTLIPSAAARGAVCLDGTVPGYHFDPGFGSGANSWLVDLEGGAWCNNIRTCVYRKKTNRGSSNYMEKQIGFSGILSNKAEENPDFYNWNRVRVRYCDSASFAGEGYDEANGLYFRGQRIWSVVMEELMSKGMRFAEKALLSGCSAGGLSSLLHCDQFRSLFPSGTVVKCLSDAGFFLDAVDVSGGRSLRSFFQGVVSLQGVANNLPASCTSRMEPSLCFFPQNIVAGIQTPTFILNAAYDVWQIQESLAPKNADPEGYWKDCKFNHSKCNSRQIQFLQGFRNEMVNALQGFSSLKQSGLFINSCFDHCQSETQERWFGDNSPAIGTKGIATSVGDWYFERSQVKAIDCPFPCDNTCHNMF